LNKMTTQHRKHGLATAKDVAKQAGVSITTVSRVFRSDGITSSKTREKVRRIANDLGYRPNIAARALASRRSSLIGLLVSNFEDPENLEVFRFVSAEAQKRGYHAILLNISQESEQIESVSAALQYQVDGLLISTSRLPNELIERNVVQGKPIVIVGRKSQRPEYSSVYCDNAAGATVVAEYLYNKGCQRLAFIGGKAGATVTKERKEGFVKRIEELYGFQPITRMTEGNDYESGYRVATELMSLPKPPDGIFCSNDLLAISTKDALAEGNAWNQSETVTVVGFGGTLLSKLAAYQLSTVTLPVEDMVRSATTLLIEQIETKEYIPKEIVLKDIKTTFSID
jgi:DNA-binding LacI/PurR family transcriptional regulator